MLFQLNTSSDKQLSKCFGENGRLEYEGKEFIKVFLRKFHQSFRKFRRVNSVKEDEVSLLISSRNKLIQALKSCSQDEGLKLEEQIKVLEDKICSKVEDSNMKRFLETFCPLINSDGNVNNSIWKAKRKVFNKNENQLPTAKFDPSGRLLTDPTELKKYVLSNFTQRLRHRPMFPGLEELMNLKEELFHLRIQHVNSLPFNPWTQGDLTKVLSSLKTGKSKDPYGLISELFRPESIGSDLLQALLSLFNEVKSQLIVPNFMTLANIIPIYKGKGDRRDIENQRAIFIVNKFWDIMMKLIYNDEYDEIDSNMSDSNIGARKNKSIRNHLFIINGIINESNKKKVCLDFIVSDYRQCFDGLWSHEVYNDIFDNGLQNQNLSVIYESNKHNKVSVVMSEGQTEVGGVRCDSTR